jgi:hypothetical protein
MRYPYKKKGKRDTKKKDMWRQRKRLRFWCHKLRNVRNNQELQDPGKFLLPEPL